MLTVTCCGTRDEAEVFKKLQGSSKVTGIEIHHGWASVWSDLYPHVPQSDLDERFKIDRALLFEKLISSLPRLEHLEFDFDRNRPAPLPLDITRFDSFPDVANLTLDMWPFGRVGANSLQVQFRPTVYIDNLFEILLQNDIKLNFLLVKYPRRLRRLVRPLPLHPAANCWPTLTTFLLQQKSVEVLVLDQCDMLTNPIIDCASQSGASLKSLDLHFHERYPTPRLPHHEEIKPSLDDTESETIRIDCPRAPRAEDRHCPLSSSFV